MVFMTEAISLSAVSSVEAIEEPTNLESVVDEGKKAIRSNDLETAFEIIHRLDENSALCSSHQLGKVVDLVEMVFDEDSSEGLKLIERPFQRISFSIDKYYVSYVADGLNGAFYFEVPTSEEAAALLKETYSLFQKGESAEQLEGKVKELLNMAEGGRLSHDELIEFFIDLATLNVRKFETLIPWISPTFQVKFVGGILTLSGTFSCHGFTYTTEHVAPLTRGFSDVIPFIDMEEDVDDQVGWCFYFMEVYPEKEAELLAKAEEYLPKASSCDEKFFSLVEFAEYYLEKKDEARFDKTLKALSDVIEEMPTEKVEGALRVAGLRADWSLSQGDKVSFEKYLSDMKKLVSQLSDPETIEEALDYIEECEAEGRECFGSDTTLSMQSIKA